MFRPLNDWVLVKLDPLDDRTTDVGLVLVRPQTVRTGTVLRAGVDRLYIDGVVKRTEIKTGERIAFLAGTLDNKQGQQITYTLGEDQALMRESDILFVIEEGNPKLDK